MKVFLSVCLGDVVAYLLVVGNQPDLEAGARDDCEPMLSPGAQL